ncbi:PP2C family protein-serine/threonine phosphatase [Streptomyces marispadix]|uniref:SpoIIE family protein phosphatase n=1 Tax=Streptomyces marispadix TaxID=2922868 RepID=A0ABS9SZE4_9ACTN|nr:GAF domain-containing SpoIIE family protein phosphatase [Streptomyces marispadix]MCH6161659.1 SpoIIE family protein phosphatase [Streptomyces marispadix]
MSSPEVKSSEARLSEIQAVTDSALVHADVEELLDELLDRLREILKADTAAVLLLDRASQQLVASAAKGIEEEVIQRAHVPVGEGFAGRIAAQRQPIILENTQGAGLFNPLLEQRGIRSLLGVPMIAGGVLVGVLHVGSLTRRRFTGSDVELLQLAAGRAALAVRTVTSRSERAAARALQQSLLPAAPPPVDGAQLAVRYAPGSGDIGGDWYDVFTLPDGRLCFAMGDVVGHGLDSAVIMGRTRSALRAYALDSLDPAEVLHRLDRKVQLFEPDAMATVLYAVCEPDLARVHISSAGHLPPAMVSPGSPATFLEVEPDPVIGAEQTRPRRSTTVDFPQGALMCLYTDGLVERRDEPLQDRLALLRDSLFLGMPEAVGATIMSSLVGRHPTDDDVALLVIRRNFNRWNE